MKSISTQLRLLLACGIAGALVAQQDALAQTAATTTDSIHVQSFDKVWSLVKERHWDPEAVGESWDKARDELRPKVVAAKDAASARQVMSQLIGKLKQSHFAIVPAKAYKSFEKPSAETKGYTGLVVRERQGRLTVTQIDEGSAAKNSIIRPGWTLEKIRKKTAADLFKVADAATGDGPMTRATLVGMLCDQGLRGDVGADVEIGCTDLDGKSHTVKLTMTKAPGNRVRAGSLPAVQVTVTSKVMDGDIGYFAFSSFFDPMRLITSYDKLIAQSKGGLVIDLRGNIGGLMMLPPAIGSRLSGEASELGTVQMKGAKFKLALNPWPEPYDKPVAVLIDECSISAAEILSGGLQDLKLARVFGTRTAGLVLPSTFEKLPNGDGIQYAFADYHSASGKALERNGVTPDVEVKLTPDAFRKNSDPVLAKAREWIQSQASK